MPAEMPLADRRRVHLDHIVIPIKQPEEIRRLDTLDDDRGQATQRRILTIAGAFIFTWALMQAVQGRLGGAEHPFARDGAYVHMANGF